MRKLLYIIFLIVLSLPAAQAFAAADPCEKVSVEGLAKHIPLPSFTIAAQRERFGICEVLIKVEAETVPVYYMGDFVIAGDLFKDKKHVTAEAIDGLRSISFKRAQQDMEALVVFSYMPSKGADKILYMFTDPECPYCEMSKFQVREFAEKRNIELKVVFYPLPSHEKGREKAVRGICSKMTYSSYLEGKYGDKTCPEGEKIVSRSTVLAEGLNIGGTPTFVTRDGRVLNGYDADELDKLF